METERKLMKIPLGFRSKIPRRGIYEYQRPENFAKHNALCKRDENYGILMGKPNNAICLDYDIYDPNCKKIIRYQIVSTYFLHGAFKVFLLSKVVCFSVFL